MLAPGPSPRGAMTDYLGGDDGASSPELVQAALDSDVRHLVGKSRAYLHDLRAYLDSIASSGDERAIPVIEALGLTLDMDAPPGTLRHVERTATELLRTLTRLAETVRPR